jgi:hypothetical protein
VLWGASVIRALRWILIAELTWLIAGGLFLVR